MLAWEVQCLPELLSFEAAAFAGRPQTRARLLAARFARVMLSFHPFRKKGRREDRAPAGTRKAPMREYCTRNAQGRHRAAKRPAFPAQWFDGLCRALPGDEFLLASVAFAKFTTSAPVDAMTPSQTLDRSNDGQDHTVSPYASCPASPNGFAGHGPALPKVPQV
jgi:hypothetical protein